MLIFIILATLVFVKIAKNASFSVPRDLISLWYTIIMKHIWSDKFKSLVIITQHLITVKQFTILLININ